jgi:hypothetical protein
MIIKLVVRHLITMPLCTIIVLQLLDEMFMSCFRGFLFSKICIKFQPQIGADPTSLDRVTVQLFSIKAITMDLLQDRDVALMSVGEMIKFNLMVACNE